MLSNEVAPITKMNIIDYVLNAYSKVDRRMLLIISNTSRGHYSQMLLFTTEIDLKNTSYIFLRQDNVLKKLITYDRRAGIFFNLSEVPIFNDDVFFINKIYSNSASEIYYRSP